MNRPPLEVADIVRCAGPLFVERSRRWITWQHQKILLALARCRTAALGGHRDHCSDCGYSAISYNSCRNRHCPKCQGNARLHWLQARERELLPVSYVHVVFTLPRELAPLALQNKRLIYNLLFRASAATLLEIARDPRHLGAEIGFFSVLHTWNQRLQHHPHVHCVLAAGGLAPDHSRWISSRRSFFFPSKCSAESSAASLSPGSRTPFVRRTPVPRTPLTAHGTASLRLLVAATVSSRLGRLLQTAFRRARTCAALSRRIHPSGRHLEQQVGGSLRGQRNLSLARLRSRQQEALMTLPVDEFLRRFLLHSLPRGFMRIRNFGFLANRQRAELLPLCSRLLQSSDRPAADATSSAFPIGSLWQCPLCGGIMRVVERLSAAQLLLRSPPHLSPCAA